MRLLARNDSGWLRRRRFFSKLAKRKERAAMIGRKERAFGPLPPLTLEDRAPPDHFYHRNQLRSRMMACSVPPFCCRES